MEHIKIEVDNTKCERRALYDRAANVLAFAFAGSNDDVNNFVERRVFAHDLADSIFPSLIDYLTDFLPDCASAWWTAFPEGEECILTLMVVTKDQYLKVSVPPELLLYHRHCVCDWVIRKIVKKRGC